MYLDHTGHYLSFHTHEQCHEETSHCFIIYFKIEFYTFCDQDKVKFVKFLKFHIDFL